MLRLVSIFILLTVFAVRACGQTTQPAGGFADNVQQLATSLVAADDASLESMFDADAKIRRFNHKGTDSLDHLHTTAAGHTVVATLAYTGIPKTFATDLAGALRDKEGNDTLKRQLIPKTAAEIQRADATAANWISASIRLQPTDHLGIIVLSDVPQAGDIAQLLFVLVQSDGRQIQQLVWGDPRQQ